MQQDNSANNKRIAKNTLLLYIRMLFTMLVSLYTSRVVLKALGVDNYGIYNVVGGVVTIFSVFSGSLSYSISRFLTFELGKGNREKLNKVFSTGINIQVFMAFSIVFLLETIGLWFLYNKMVIPDGRLDAAFWVFQFSIITFVFDIISVPYNAAIIAHEKMGAFAYISIIVTVLKLFVAISISTAPIDKLIYYACMLCVISAITRIIYGIYCGRNFSECHYRFKIERKLLKEMFSFAGWNFLGFATGLTRDQGGNIILNLFFGPSVNAARGISMQVYNTVQAFVMNFMTALNPQITKQYAVNNFDYEKTLVCQGSRLGLYILLIVCIPIFLNVDFILRLWLGNYPAHTDLFVLLSLLMIMSETVSFPLTTAIQATGNIKYYQMKIGFLQLFNLPIAYIMIRMGMIPEVVVIISIIISQCCLLVRLLTIQKFIDLRVSVFLKMVYLNVIIVAIISGGLSYLFYSIIVEMESHVVFMFSSTMSILITLLSIYYVGCSKEEKIWVSRIIKHKICKNRKI
jgi:O-antigen/teichoic acid export membrane protein